MRDANVILDLVWSSRLVQELPILVIHSLAPDLKELSQLQVWVRYKGNQAMTSCQGSSWFQVPMLAGYTQGQPTDCESATIFKVDCSSHNVIESFTFQFFLISAPRDKFLRSIQCC